MQEVQILYLIDDAIMIIGVLINPGVLPICGAITSSNNECVKSLETESSQRMAGNYSKNDITVHSTF